MSNIKLGAHLSIAGGFQNALLKIIEIGGNCLQIFSSSPRSWNIYQPKIDQINSFLEYQKKFSIFPVYFHASYLINLADSKDIGEKSVQSLINELILAEKMQIKGTIIHLGSFRQKNEKPSNKQYTLLLNNIQIVLDKTPQTTKFIIENAGNKKLCWSLDEIGFIVKELNNPRIRVCLDTCHLWAAGYDLSSRESFKRFWDYFDKQIGMNFLELFQVNDSKDPQGSFRDRHENIGKGTIPPKTFHLLLTDKLTQDKPFIIETPGFDKKGPDKANLDRLKSLIKYHQD